MSNRKKSSAKGKGKGKQSLEFESEEVLSRILDDQAKISLAFKVLPENQTNELMELTVEEVDEKLKDILNLGPTNADLKSAAVIDYYTGGFWWAKEQNFDAKQISGFFTLIHTLMENIKEKNTTLVENIKEFKKMLVGIGVENCEISGGLDFFSLEQGKNITDYMHMCLFQHYKLFEFMFSHAQAEEIIGLDLNVDVPKPADMPWPAPLDEAVPEDLYLTHIATPPPTPVPEEKPDEKAQEEQPSEEDLHKEEEIFSTLTPEQIRDIIDSVCKETLAGVETEIAAKLREKENTLINRINKIHKVAES